MQKKKRFIRFQGQDTNLQVLENRHVGVEIDGHTKVSQIRNHHDIVARMTQFWSLWRQNWQSWQFSPYFWEKHVFGVGKLCIDFQKLRKHASDSQDSADTKIMDEKHSESKLLFNQGLICILFSHLGGQVCDISASNISSDRAFKTKAR